MIASRAVIFVPRSLNLRLPERLRIRRADDRDRARELKRRHFGQTALDGSRSNGKRCDALTRAEYRARNPHDLDGFLETVFGHTGSVGPGTIAGPFRIDGLGALYFGKTETAI